MNGEDREMLEHIRQLLLEEQRRIRMFVEGHRSSNFAELAGLRAEIQELIGKLKRVWNCEVELTVSPEDARIGRALSDPLDFLVAESIANAVQHGDASRVDVSAKLSPDRLLLRIADNGRGLPGVIGVYRDGELASHKIGPVSLRNRVADLKGSLTLSTSSAGVVLQISMPLAVS